MPLDRTNIRSMLGLRFRDAVTERPVADGLRVSVHRTDGTGRPVEAVQTLSGAFVAQGLPGLRAYERSQASLPADAASFFVSVEDERSRFVPVVLKVDLPKPNQSGLYPIVETPSDVDAQTDPDEHPEPACYLFASVRRPVPPGHAVVYADLVHEDTNPQGDRVLKPASHAVLQVTHVPASDGSNGSPSNGGQGNGGQGNGGQGNGGQGNGGQGNGGGPNGGGPNGGPSNGGGRTYYGIADERGQVAVQFPLPPVQLEELKAPPGESNSTNGNSTSNGAGRPLSSRTWELKIRAKYEGLDAPSGAARPLLPDVLQQEFRNLYASDGGGGKEALTKTLQYGRPLTLQTTGLPDDRVALRIESAP